MSCCLSERNVRGMGRPWGLKLGVFILSMLHFGKHVEGSWGKGARTSEKCGKEM